MKTTPSNRKIRRKRPRIEVLETRRLLATLVVNSTNDAVDLSPGDGICEISAGGPCTLRAAVQEANALDNVDGPDEITLPAGIFALSLAGISEGQALTGDLDFTDPVIVRGAGAGATVIDGMGIDRVIDVVQDSLTLRDVTVRGGLIQDDEFLVEGSGGGIRNEGSLTLLDSIVTGNVATHGSGVANYNGAVRIERSVITGNGDANSVQAGGVLNYSNYDPATTEILYSTVSDNRADEGGGAVNRGIDGTATLTITRSTLSGNLAADGGAISNRALVYADPVAANLTIRGSTLSGNTASNSAGGILSQAEDGGFATSDIGATTITDNESTSGDGGGLSQIAGDGVSATIQNSILSGNRAGGSGADLSADVISASFNLIGTSDGHPIVNGVNNNLIGSDPLLGPLQDNGGLTQTHLLSEGSPAIDAGSNPEAFTSDQRGTAFARTIDDPGISNAGDGTDIGAIEVGQQASTLDFGDAPESIIVGGTLRRYPTRLASDAARHALVAGSPSLGSVFADAEPDGQPTATATGDDLVGIDDEDAFGGSSIVMTPGQALTGISISHDGGVAGGNLSTWIDLNLDGDWDDVGEQVLTDVAIPAGVSSTALDIITIPASTPSGTTFVRVRVSTDSGLGVRGEASDGEVEDFAATVGAPPLQIADLSITHRVNDAEPELGQDITFTITLRNDGPDPASNVEVTALLPLELVFTRSTVTTGEYDDLDGLWLVDDLAAGATAVLTITATIDTSDSLMFTAEVTDVDQQDPDSTPGNGIGGEDDQESVAVGTCLSGGEIQVGKNQLVYSCASPGAFTAFVIGTERGAFTFEEYGTTVDIADAKVVAIAAADVTGNAHAVVDLSEDDLAGTVLIQAFGMFPRTSKTNTVALSATAELLRATTVGPGGLRLQPEVLPDLIDAAISSWASAGVDAEDLARMSRARVSITELPGDVIGRTTGNTVILDADAAGHGWFVDDTPSDDSEFAADSLHPAKQQVDALTALIHEFGHVIGLHEVDQPHHVMNGFLGAGIRRSAKDHSLSNHRLDVNGDGAVSALDALLIVNRLNVSNVNQQSDFVGNSNRWDLDTNRDEVITAIDALLVINHLGRQQNNAEGSAVDLQWFDDRDLQTGLFDWSLWSSGTNDDAVIE